MISIPMINYHLSIQIHIKIISISFICLPLPLPLKSHPPRDNHLPCPSEKLKQIETKNNGNINDNQFV